MNIPYIYITIGGIAGLMSESLWGAIIASLLAFVVVRFIISTFGNTMTRSESKFVVSTNLILCRNSMEEFHNVLSDTVLTETGLALAQHPEMMRMSIITYEIQAALAAAKKFRIDQKYHQDFAAAVLTRGGIQIDVANGMVSAVLNASSEVMDWTKDTVDGAKGYEELTLGADSLAQHVKDMIFKLQNMPKMEDIWRS
jgi:hypothetical protein